MTEMHRFVYTNIPEMRSRDTVVFQVLCSSMSYSHGPSILEQALVLGYENYYFTTDHSVATCDKTAFKMSVLTYN